MNRCVKLGEHAGDHNSKLISVNSRVASCPLNRPSAHWQHASTWAALWRFELIWNDRDKRGCQYNYYYSNNHNNSFLFIIIIISSSNKIILIFIDDDYYYYLFLLYY